MAFVAAMPLFAIRIVWMGVAPPCACAGRVCVVPR